jgi:hypothetical protein
MKMVGLPSRNISSFLHPIKSDVDLKISGMCSIPCTGQIRHSAKTRVKQHIHFYHPQKSAMAEYNLNLDHCIQL